MKIKPEQYAQMLVACLKDGDPKEIAKNFWSVLQKNNQYKDLAKILSSLDREYAKANNKTLFSIYSSSELPKEKLDGIKKRLERTAENDIELKNIVNPDQVGIMVKSEDMEINLTLENKINKLKQALQP